MNGILKEGWGRLLGFIFVTTLIAIIGFGCSSNDDNETPQSTITDADVDQDGYTENEGDCDDADSAIHPGANEICGDGTDQDCDGSDSDCVSELEDTDDDGDGYTENEDDCDDADSDIHPGANEICGDGTDQDCDGIDLICDSEPVADTFRIIADIKDPDLHLGKIMATHDYKGGLSIGGQKDTTGELMTITDMTWMPDIDTPQEALHIHLDYDRHEATMMTPSGDFVKIDNFDNDAKTATIKVGKLDSDGSEQIISKSENVPVKDDFMERLEGWQEQLKGTIKAILTLAEKFAPIGIKWIFNSAANEVEAEMTPDDKCTIDKFSIIATLYNGAKSWGECIFNLSKCNWWKSTADLFKSVVNAFTSCTEELDESKCCDELKVFCETTEYNYTGIADDGSCICLVDDKVSGALCISNPCGEFEVWDCAGGSWWCMERGKEWCYE